MIPVSVHILDKEYQVACAEDERDGLLHAADFVNQRMKEIRDRGNVIGTDRIAVVTAHPVSATRIVPPRNRLLTWARHASMSR